MLKYAIIAAASNQPFNENMTRTISLCMVWAGTLLLTIAATPALACDEEAMRTLMVKCLDESQPDSSANRKKGQAWLIEGRFCDSTDRVVDGFLLCQGHDAKAIGVAMACKPAEQLKISAAVLKEDDARRPASCR